MCYKRKNIPTILVEQYIKVNLKMCDEKRELKSESKFSKLNWPCYNCKHSFIVYKA